MTNPSIETADLVRSWAELRAERPKIRIRDAASELGVTELELLETDLGGGVTRLRSDVSDLLEELQSLGEVMALTRNEACVIETDGAFDGVQVFEHAAQVVAPGIDLRIFPSRWVHAYAVEQDGKGGPRRSVQVFDRDGTAMHKVYLREHSDLDAYRQLVGRLRHEGQARRVRPDPEPEPEAEQPDVEVDRDGLLAAWGALTDTHDFFRILRRYRVGRTQALRLAEGRFSRPVATASGRHALEAAALDGVPVMVFVGNRGTIQIHTGPVERTFEHERWFNVMDPGFNLHLDQDLVAHAWVVEKPTDRGPATSLELYDAGGDQIVSVFGVRKPGSDGGAAWKALTEGLS